MLVTEGFRIKYVCSQQRTKPQPSRSTLNVIVISSRIQMPLQRGRKLLAEFLPTQTSKRFGMRRSGGCSALSIRYGTQAHCYHTTKDLSQETRVSGCRSKPKVDLNLLLLFIKLFCDRGMTSGKWRTVDSGLSSSGSTTCT